MIRSITATLVLGASLLACNDQESVVREQQEEQRELSREQAEERQELAREQAEERDRAAAAAREDLSDQTAEVREQQGELTAEQRQLQETVALACQGTPANLVDACPIDRRYLTAANDTREGVTFHLNESAGSEAEFERRVACYRARASLRAGATPTPVPSKDSGQLAFSAGDRALALPLEQTPWLDVRDKAEFAVLRKAKARDAWLWRIFIGSAAAMLMFGVGELALVGGHFWQKARQAQVAAQLPVVQKARTAHELAARIEELATQRLLPFEMIDAVKAKRRSIQFQRVTASASGLNQLVIEAQTSSPADVSAYQTELTQNPAIETAEVGELRSRDRVTTFTLTVTFKAGALKPVPTT
ncbi:MAG TPA: hypothetical protein PK392_13480 [Opitutaceae bacterium]|nr:hypothetical protein [Opitutaceae bacterium]